MRIATAFFLLSLSWMVWGQSMPFLHFTTEGVLPHKVGFQILPVQEGLILVGTDNGLCSFDKGVFQTYSVEDGLLGAFWQNSSVFDRLLPPGLQPVSKTDFLTHFFSCLGPT
jgi:hypothetical protein